MKQSLTGLSSQSDYRRELLILSTRQQRERERQRETEKMMGCLLLNIKQSYIALKGEELKKGFLQNIIIISLKKYI